MQELLRTLSTCGVSWKKNGPYNFKCRAVVGSTAPPRGNAVGGGAGDTPMRRQQQPQAAAQQPLAADDMVAGLLDGDGMMEDGQGGGAEQGGAAAPPGLQVVKFEAQLYKVGGVGAVWGGDDTAAR